jgi:hypothetical protein
MNIISLDVKQEKRMTKKKEAELLRMELEQDDNDNDDNDDVDVNGNIAADPAIDQSQHKSGGGGIVREDWLPWWDLLIPKGYTVDNIKNFHDRHCGNCARGYRATSFKYKKSPRLLGCGISARVERLENGMVRVTSHCSGHFFDYPESAIEMGITTSKRRSLERQAEREKDGAQV